MFVPCEMTSLYQLILVMDMYLAICIGIMTGLYVCGIVNNVTLDQAHIFYITRSVKVLDHYKVLCMMVLISVSQHGGVLEGSDRHMMFI